jgi:hypothetical protein
MMCKTQKRVRHCGILPTWEAEMGENPGLKPVWGNGSQDPISKVIRAKD